MCGGGAPAPGDGDGGGPEHLVRLITHVCCQQLSGVFSCVASLSRGCWRGCGARPEEGCPACVVAWAPRQQQQQQQQQATCRWQGPPPRWRDRCLCQHGNSIGGGGVPPAPTTHHLYSPPPTPPTTTTCRTGLPPQHSLLAVLLLLVATLARFTEGCSSRSTPKPRPPSPTLRPNITFQTYACPPAYAAWYCLNGATCFTVKIGESILYNCECADGYMGQRCEFKDLDGSYLPAREKVLLETASIAGGATVACVLVFVVLFAIYVFMQKDKDKNCRDLDDGRENDRQPFSGYQNPRPEIIRTISNPYARTVEELSHVEVQPTKLVANPESSGNMDSSSNSCTTNINSSERSGNIDSSSNSCTTNINSSERSGNMENSSNSCATNTQTNVHNAQDPS